MLTTADDHALARELAERAGERLLDLRAQHLRAEHLRAEHLRAPGQQDALRNAGDRLSHEFLIAELKERRPDDYVLSEEAADNLVRLTAQRVWIVDPLDGTREFGDVPRTDWAVHVALWERDKGLTAGAVALPARGKVLSTADHTTTEIRSAENKPPRVVVSRSRAPQFVKQLAVELTELGSAGAKVAAVVLGEADAYIHAGGFYEWDTAAPVAVARKSGLHASRLNGSELTYNQAELRQEDILVCRPEMAEALLREIREVTHAS